MPDSNAEIAASFDPVVTRYRFLSGAWLCVITVIGIPILPIWLLGFGQWFSAETLRRTSCVISEDKLQIRTGVFFRSVVSMPLDRITDLTIFDGPIMRYFGISGLKVETAGQSTGAGTSEGQLVGIVDAVRFRDQVLSERDKLVGRAEPDSADFLKDIRDSVLRIEKALSDS